MLANLIYIHTIINTQILLIIKTRVPISNLMCVFNAVNRICKVSCFFVIVFVDYSSHVN